jgi:hypothetical protein
LKLSYEWSVGRNGAIVPLRGTHGPMLKITKAIFKRALPAEGRILFCTVTARNAGGSFKSGLSSAPLKQ